MIRPDDGRCPEFPAGLDESADGGVMSTEPARLDGLRVLYQSEDYIVVDKHWDIRIDSKMWYEKHTVQAQLRQRFPHLADPNTYYGFRSEPHEPGTSSLLRADSSSSLLLLPGSVTSWISPPVELSASPSVKLLLAKPTAASRTGRSPRRTSLWSGAETHSSSINVSLERL